MTRPLRIAVLGSRGVPATFGGIEHHVEEIGRRLVERGHEVIVFCESAYLAEHPSEAGEHHGMRLVVVPSVRSKHLEALAHSGRSTLRTIGRGYDIVHYHAVGPGVFSFVPRWFGRAKVVQTIHGLDAERAKWGRAARTMLRSATWLSARVPDTTVVVSRALGDHYRRRYGRACVYIPNGTDPAPRPEASEIVARFGLQGRAYVLFVGRMVPEKCPDLLIDAYRDVSGELPLVLAGGTSYTDEFIRGLSTAAARDPRVRMIGYVYGRALEELYANAAVFVLPSSLEGLPLTLLEAIAARSPVVASDIEPHVEVLERSRPGGRLFTCGDRAALAMTVQQVIDDLPAERRGVDQLSESVSRRYDWDMAVDRLEELYVRLTSSSRHFSRFL